MKTECELKILFVAGDLSDGGGVNRVIADLSALFACRLPLLVSVLPTGGGKTSYRFSDSVRRIAPDSTKRFSWGGLRQLWREIRSNDIVVGFWSQDNILISVLCLLAGRRAVCCEHTSFFHLSSLVQWVRRLVYPLAWRVAVLNETEKVHYRTYLPAQKVVLIPNPVRIAPMENAAYIERKKIVLGVGHFIERKGFVELVKAFAQAGLERYDWELVLVGSGPELQAIKRQIVECNLKQVRIIPETPDIVQWYRDARILVVSSNIEVFSLVLAEAALSGVCPIAYKADGPMFLLESAPQCLVEIGDVQRLSRRISEFALDDKYRIENCDLARESVARKVDPCAVVTIWAKLLGVGLRSVARRSETLQGRGGKGQAELNEHP